MTDRIPPQSLESEQAALGAMLLETQAIERAVDMLRPEDFYREAHRVIFQAIADLFSRREPVDLITLGEWFKAREQLEAIGGTLYLTTIMAQVPTAAGIAHYCKTIREKATLRAMIRAADEIQEAAYAGSNDTELLLAQAGEKFDLLATSRESTEEFKTIGQYAGEEFIRLEREIEDGVPPGILVGMPQFDEKTSGFKPGDLTLIGALPNVGKSHFVLSNIAIPAGRAGAKVLFVTMEMKPGRVAGRAMITVAEQTKNWHLKNTELRNANWVHGDASAAGIYTAIGLDMAQACEALWNLPIFVHQPNTLTPNSLSVMARRQRRKTGLDMIIIDYVQRMNGDGKFASIREEMIQVSHGLQRAAQALQVPIVAVSSLNRAGATRTNKRPVKSDLAESSALEYDADLVFYLHRPAEYDEHRDFHETEGIIAKNRHGPLGIIKLWFEDEKNVFREVE